MQENIKAESDRRYAIEQPDPNCNKGEWVRGWNNALTYCKSKVVTPTNVSSASVPSQFETTSVIVLNILYYSAVVLIELCHFSRYASQ